MATSSGKSSAKKEDASGHKLVASNKKARHDYHIEDTRAAQLVLQRFQSR